MVDTDFEVDIEKAAREQKLIMARESWEELWKIVYEVNSDNGSSEES